MKTDSGLTVTRAQIRIDALMWAGRTKDNAKDFKATNGWCTRFMKRHNLELRLKTKIAQRLPSDLDDEIAYSID